MRTQRRSLRLHRSLSLGALLFLCACDLFGPSAPHIGSWRLVRLGGYPIPAVIHSYSGYSGVLVSDVIELRGEWQFERVQMYEHCYTSPEYRCRPDPRVFSGRYFKEGDRFVLLDGETAEDVFQMDSFAGSPALVGRSVGASAIFQKRRR